MQHQRGAQPNPPSQESKDPKKVKQLRLVCGMISNHSKLVVSFKQMFFVLNVYRRSLVRKKRCDIFYSYSDATSKVCSTLLSAHIGIRYGLCPRIDMNSHPKESLSSKSLSCKKCIFLNASKKYCQEKCDHSQ